MPTNPEDPGVLLPPFQESLPGTLRIAGEKLLLERLNLTRATYTTKRFLTGIVSTSDEIVQTVPIGAAALHFEAPSPELKHYCAQHGLRLANPLDIMAAADLVKAALFETIESCRFLFCAVAELVWRCHVVDAQHDDYDVSFSDPAIPFSVFISAPRRNERQSILRVAESLVHEAMHLQLTLFELRCPLIDTASNWLMYSPWKQQERPAQGILHGLYVFHVLHWMWQQISAASQNENDRDFALRRAAQIKDEIALVRAIENSPALTESGNLFLRQLFVT